jgi:hypothetical protein
MKGNKMRVNSVKTIQTASHGISFGVGPSNLAAAKRAEAKNHTPFHVLGDFAERDYPDQVRAERAKAGLDNLPAGIKAKREWYYWEIETRMCKPLPRRIVRKIMETAGEEVQAHSFLSGKRLESSVYRLHVSTEEGLQFLSKTLVEYSKSSRIIRFFDTLGVIVRNL